MAANESKAIKKLNKQIKKLDARMDKLKADFKDKSKANKEGSMNRNLRPIAKELDFLRFVKQKFVRYL